MIAGPGVRSCSCEELPRCLLCAAPPSRWRSLATYDYYTDAEPVRVRLNECRNCGLLFLSPRPDPAARLAHFDRASYTTPDPA